MISLPRYMVHNGDGKHTKSSERTMWISEVLQHGAHQYSIYIYSAITGVGCQSKFSDSAHRCQFLGRPFFTYNKDVKRKRKKRKNLR